MDCCIANTVVSFLLELIITSYNMVKTNRKRLLRTLNLATSHVISGVSEKARVSTKTGQPDRSFWKWNGLFQRFSLETRPFPVFPALPIPFCNTLILLALLFQTLDSAIHRINYYPADNAIVSRDTYPLDIDLIRWIALSNFWTTGTRTE